MNVATDCFSEILTLSVFGVFTRRVSAGLVWFSRSRARVGSEFPDAASLQKYVGVVPVTERSGNKSWVHWRFACPTFQRQTFIEWLGQTVPRSFLAKAFYQSYRERGGPIKLTCLCVLDSRRTSPGSPVAITGASNSRGRFGRRA